MSIIKVIQKYHIKGIKMKLTKELISVKEYCKKNNITDAAVRKKIKNNKVISLVYEDITYIVIENNDKEKLKNNIKLKNSKIRELQKEIKLYTNQQETIIKLEKDYKERLKENKENYEETKQVLKDVIGNYNSMHLISNKIIDTEKMG